LPPGIDYGGSWDMYKRAATAAQAVIDARLDHLGTLLNAASDGLGDLLRHYAETDLRHHDVFDQQRKRHGPPYPETNAERDDASYADYDNSLPAYTATQSDHFAYPGGLMKLVPPDTAPFPWWIDTIMQQGGILFSPTAAATTIISMAAGGKNPADDIVQHFTGDWGAANRTGLAIGQIAAYLTAVADGIATAKGRVMGYWEGNSAEAANSYFNQLVKALDDEATSLSSVTTLFTQLASSMEMLGLSMEGLVSLAAGLIVTAIALAIALGPTAITGVGALFDGTALAACIGDLASTFAEIYMVIDVVVAACEALAGVAGMGTQGQGAIDQMQAVADIALDPYADPTSQMN